MKKLFLPIAFLFALPIFAQQINPATQITWPRVTGAGTPTALSIACSSSNYGQPYQNTAVTPNTNYSCTTTGWQLVNGGAGSSGYFTGTPTVAVSGTPTTGQVLTASSGSAATFQTPSGGGLSGQTASCVPKAATATTSTSSAAICDADGQLTISEPTTFSGSGPPITIQASSPATGSATNAVIGADSGGNAILNNNNVGASPIATNLTFAAPPPLGSTTPAAVTATNLTSRTPLNTQSNANCPYQAQFGLGQTFCNFIAMADDGLGQPLTGGFSAGVSNTGRELIEYGPGVFSSTAGPTYESRYNASDTTSLVKNFMGGQNMTGGVSRYIGTGDGAGYNYFALANGVAFPADEGWVAEAWSGGDQAMISGTVGSLVSNVLAVNSPTCPSVGVVGQMCIPAPGTRIADTSTAYHLRLTGTGANWTPGCGLGFSTLTSTGTVPAFSVWGCVAGSANINTNTVVSSPVTVTLPAFTAGSGTFTIGDNVCVIGTASPNNGWIEQSVVTGAAGSAGTQTLTMKLGFSQDIVLVKKGNCGILAQDAYTQNATTPPGIVYIGSLDGSTLIYREESHGTTGVYDNGIPSAPEQAIANPAFASSTVYTLGQLIFDGTTNCGGYGCNQRVTTAGTSAGTPSWSGTVGSQVTSGSVTFTNVNVITLATVYPYAARILLNNWTACTAPDGRSTKCYATSQIEPVAGFTPGDTVQDFPFDLAVRSILQENLHCTTPSYYPTGCNAAEFGTSGINGGPPLSVRNDNPTSMYYVPGPDPTIVGGSAATGVAMPDVISSLGGGGSQMFSSFWKTPYTPRDCVFCFTSNQPGQAGVSLFKFAGGGGGPGNGVDLYENFATGTLEAHGNFNVLRTLTAGSYQSVNTINGQLINNQCISGGCAANEGALFANLGFGGQDSNGEVRIATTYPYPTLSFESGGTRVGVLTYDGTNLAIGSARGLKDGTLDLANINLTGAFSCTGTGCVTGSGASPYLAIWTGSNTLGSASSGGTIGNSTTSNTTINGNLLVEQVPTAGTPNGTLILNQGGAGQAVNGELRIGTDYPYPTMSFENASGSVYSRICWDGTQLGVCTARGTSNGAWKVGSLTDTGALNMSSGQVINWNSDLGLSRDSAGVLDCGNGTAGNKTCILNLQSLNASSNITATSGTSVITENGGVIAGSVSSVGTWSIQTANGTATFSNLFVGTTATATPGTGITSVTCATATCTNLRGTYTVVGGTATTGTIFSLAWAATPTATVCTATMNGGTGFLGIGNSIATTTGMNITAGVTVLGVTFNVNYSCQP